MNVCQTKPGKERKTPQEFDLPHGSEDWAIEVRAREEEEGTRWHTTEPNTGGQTRIEGKKNTGAKEAGGVCFAWRGGVATAGRCRLGFCTPPQRVVVFSEKPRTADTPPFSILSSTY